MARGETRIDYLQDHQPATWSLLKLAASQGLASIDRPHDDVRLGSQLQKQQPRMHFVLSGLLREFEMQPRLQRR